MQISERRGRPRLDSFSSQTPHCLATRSYIAIMRSIIQLLSLSALLVPVQSLYFYIDGTSTAKCFFEELPKDTLVVGHYTAEEYDEDRKMWAKHDGLSIFISVDVRLWLPPFSNTFRKRNIELTPPKGSIRQRPPRSITEGPVIGPVHLQRRGFRRPQDLLHAVFDVRWDGLAVGASSPGRSQAHSGSGDWGDQCHREYG